MKKREVMLTLYNSLSTHKYKQSTHYVSRGVLHIHFIPVVRVVQANICPELDQFSSPQRL